MTIMTLDIPPIVMETDSGDDISKTTKRRPNCTTTTTTTTNDAVVSRSTDRRKIGGVRRAISGGPSLSSVRREAEKFNSSLSGFSKSSLPPSTPKRRSSGDHRQRISSADIQRVRTGGSSTADSDDGTVTSSNSFEQQQQQQNNKEHRIRRNRTSDASQISRLSCSDGDIALTFSPTPSGNSSTSATSNLGTSNKSKSKRRSSLSSSSQLGDSTTTTTATATVTDDSSSQSSSDKRIDSSGDKKSSPSRRSNASNGKGYSEKGKQNARSRRMARAASSDDAVGDEAIATATPSPSASPSASATRTPKSGSRAQRQRVSVPGNEIVQLLSTDCELPLVTGEDDTKSEKGKQNARSRRMAHAASSDNAVVDEATVTASAPVIPKPGSSVQSQRVSVSENEIMQLLSPPSKKVRSGRLRVRRSSSPNDDGDGDDQKNLKRSKSLVNRKDRGTSRPKEKSGDSVPSIKKQEAESDTPNPQSGRTELKLKEYGARRSNSSGALSKRTRQLRRSSNDNDEKRKNHRKPPRRSRSDDLALGNGTDDGLGSFLKHSDTVSRRKKGGSGSRSVASTPIRQHKSRRHHSKVKPIYSDDILEEGDGEDQSDSEVNHNRSLDLDLATARGNFGAQQHLNEKLQLHLTKTDELLYSVFPKHVADALRNGQKVAPENHDIVTIFFCDIGKYYDFKQKQKNATEYFYSKINALFTFVVSH